MVDMDNFIDKLTEKGLISVSQEIQLKRMEYSKQVDETFYILIAKDPEPTSDMVEKILKEMGREDIITKLQGDSSEYCLYLFVNE